MEVIMFTNDIQEDVDRFLFYIVQFQIYIDAIC